MADHRTLRQKLEAMAAQTASPHEAEIAKRKLAEMDAKKPKQTPRESVRFGPGHRPGEDPTSFDFRTYADIFEALNQYENPFWTSGSSPFRAARGGKTASQEAFRKWWQNEARSSTSQRQTSWEERNTSEFRKCIHGLAWEHCFTNPVPPTPEGRDPLIWEHDWRMAHDPVYKEKHDRMKRDEEAKKKRSEVKKKADEEAWLKAQLAQMSVDEIRRLFDEVFEEKEREDGWDEPGPWDDWGE